MLWIISGSYHSGKNTLRNILATKYGFTVINKHILPSTANFVVQEIEDDAGQKSIVAKRDPFLVVHQKNDQSTIANALRDLFGATSNAEKEKIIKKAQKDSEWLIYDKSPQDYYIIRVGDLMKAINDEDKNYLLVCSNPDTIKKIKLLPTTHSTMLQGMDSDAAIKRIKAILIFGLNGVSDQKEKSKAAGAASKKIKGFFKNMAEDNFIYFDYILYNKNGTDKIKILTDAWEHFFIKLREEYHEEEGMNAFRPFCYGLKTNEQNYIDGEIFFIKPFGVPNSRADLVLTSVKKAVEAIVQDKSEYKIKQDKGDDYYFDFNNLVHVVNYTEDKKAQEQMCNQIKDAHMIIADMADIDDKGMPIHKPNCYWELGYARALQKDIIILVDKNASDKPIPFDESNHIYITYELLDSGIKFISQSGQETQPIEFEPRIKRYLKRLTYAASAKHHNEYIMDLVKLTW